MDMEPDYSTLSSEGSIQSSEFSHESLRLEECRVEGVDLRLPQDLCESKDIFKEFFSIRMWQDCFTEQQKQQLKSFLPSFPENDEQEKEETVRRLFARENFRFGSPLTQFHNQLISGYFRPDIARMRSLMKRAQVKDYRYRQRRHALKLMRTLLVSRQRLLEAALQLPPGAPLPRPPPSPPITFSANSNLSTSGFSPPLRRKSQLEHRVRRRYFEELAAIRSEVQESDHSSEDDNYPDGPPTRLNKRQKRQLAVLESQVPRHIVSTLALKPTGLDLEANVSAQHNPYELSEESYRGLLLRHKRRRLEGDGHPELVTTGLTLGEITVRSQFGRKQGATYPFPASITSPSTVRATSNHIQQPSPQSTPPPPPPRRRGRPDTVARAAALAAAAAAVAVVPPAPISRLQPPDSSEASDPDSDRPGSDSHSEEEEEEDAMDSDTGTDAGSPARASTPVTPAPSPSPLRVIARGRRPSSLSSSSPRSSRGSETPRSFSQSLMQPLPMMPISRIKVEPEEDAQEAATAVASITGGIVTETPDRIPSPTAASSGPGVDIMLPDIKPAPELMQDTHSCFFSLIRDVLCSTPHHRMALGTLSDRLRAWQESPISPLNDWYCLAESWPALLPSAVAFLCGEFPEAQPDDFVPFLEHKHSLGVYQWIGAGRDSDVRLLPLCRLWIERRHEMKERPRCQIQSQVSTTGTTNSGVGATASGEEVTVEDRVASPPPPRCPTNWSVRPSTAEEKLSFREQERLRYEHPHRAFTYRLHGYESVVGPVKGAYGGGGAGANKPRGHSLLVADRPNFVTILALVRDATARLPNGEGTRSDICELLRDSQYLAAAGAQDSLLHSVVSGALDRLHCGTDPCVRYDTKRKTWLYLHRARSELEFERLHQQHQGAAKNKTSSGPRKVGRSKKETNTNANAGNTAAATAAAVAAATSAIVSRTSSAAVVSSPGSKEVLVPTVTPVAPISATTSVTTAPSISPAPVSLSLPLVTAANTRTVPVSTATLLSGKSILASPVQVKTTPSNTVGSTGIMKTVTLTPQQVQAVATARSVVAAQAKTATVRMPLTDGQQNQQLTQVQSQQQIGSPRTRGMVPSTAKTLAGLAGVRLVNASSAGGTGPQTIFIRQQAVQGKGQAGTPTITAQTVDGLQSVTPQQQQILLQQQAKQVAAIAQLQQQLQQQQQLKQLQLQQQSQQSQQQAASQQQSQQSQQQTPSQSQQTQGLQQKQQALTSAQPRLVTTMSVLGTGQQRVITRVGGKPIPVSHVALASAGAHAQGGSSNAVTRTVVTPAALAGQPAMARMQGQVISVESLLAQQQKQQSQQVKTVQRVTAGQAQAQASAGPSLIQLSAPGGPPQFAVVSQGSLLSVGGQPARLVHQAATTSGQTGTGTGNKLTNATPTATGLRVLGPSAAGLNLAHIGGKPVILASKPTVAAAAAGGPSLRPGMVLTSQAGGQTVSTGAAVAAAGSTGTAGQAPQTVVLASQALRTNAGGALLLQGTPTGTQQILLPSGFAGGTLNIKTLQGLKVIPLTQAGNAAGGGTAATKGRQQVYARIIGPGLRACSPGLQTQPTVVTTSSSQVTSESSSTPQE